MQRPRVTRRSKDAERRSAAHCGSRYNQLIALVKQAAADGAKTIRLHVLTDGRDVPDVRACPL